MITITIPSGNGIESGTTGAASLSYHTKFNLSRRLELFFNNEYFTLPPGAPHGEQPKLGILRPSLMRRAAAFSASSTPEKT